MPSLRHRHFRDYVFGSFVSNLGGQLQSWAIAWHLFQLTGSSAAVGIAGLVRVGPLLVFSLYGGVVADQRDRRSLLLMTQTAMGLVAFALFGITAAGMTTVAALYALVALEAVARAFNGPARQATLAGLVPPEHFPNAASVNGIQWRLSDILGPMLMGLLLGVSGKGVSGLALCYLLNSVSFLAVMWAVWRMPARPPEPRPRQSVSDVIASIRDGLRFVRSMPLLKNAMWIDFWATLLAGVQALLPAFATKVLHLDERGYGVLASSGGIGALIAATALAYLPTIRRQGRWVILMVGAYGACTAFFGLSPNLLTACVFLAGTGAADMISTVLRQTIRQLSTPDEMRGRMSAISVLFHVTGPQLGDFEAGVAADALGERTSVLLGGIGSLLVSGWYWLRAPALKRHEHDS